jgi:hypothetical protein
VALFLPRRDLHCVDMRCQGLSTGPCPTGRNDNSVRLGEGDLMLCSDCDRTRHLEFLANRAKQPASSSTSVQASSLHTGTIADMTGTATSDVPSTAKKSSVKQCIAKGGDTSKLVYKSEIYKTVTVISTKNDIIQKASKLVCNEMLAYVACFRNKANADSLRRVVLACFSPEDICAAKKLMYFEFQDELVDSMVWTERRNSTSRAAHEAETDDILAIFDILDAKSTFESYLFIGTNLAILPKYGPEEINIATIVDRQARMEATVNKFSCTFMSDADGLGIQLKAFESNIASQLQKLNGLSEQLTVAVKSICTQPQRSEPDANMRDRSTNVVMFGVNESADASVWRQTVIDALRHILGRDVAIDDMFRLGKYAASKVRPVLVHLHSTWDRRLIVSSSFKLKSFDVKIFVSPDEPVEVRRQRQLNRVRAKAEREGKVVSVADGVLSVDDVAVFSVKDGFIKHDDC